MIMNLHAVSEYFNYSNKIFIESEEVEAEEEGQELIVTEV